MVSGFKTLVEITNDLVAKFLNIIVVVGSFDIIKR